MNRQGLATRNGHDAAGSREIEALDLRESPASIEAFTRAEIDVQIATARRHPRSVDRAYKEALSLATFSPEIAARCTYALPRGKEPIIGKSVRLAEIVQSAWGNIRTSSRIVGEDARFITAQSICVDVEKNVGISIEVRRRITYNDGNKYNDDMIGVTGNAAVSIAFRNSVFRVVPGAFSDGVWEAAKACAAGDSVCLADRRATAIEYFAKRGVSEARIFHALGVYGLADVDLTRLTILQGFQTSLRDGMSLDTLFPVDIAPEAPVAGESRSKAVLRDVKAKAAPKSPPKPVEPEEASQEPPDDDGEPWDSGSGG